ncbi:hypothetical protein ABZP36_021916 [Zizania latifolia]
MLARLRDSKVMARSLRSAVAAMAVPTRLLPLSFPPPSTRAAAVGDGGGVPHFVGAMRGPRYPLRSPEEAGCGQECRLPASTVDGRHWRVLGRVRGGAIGAARCTRTTEND